MRTLVIAIALGAIAYFIFIYEPKGQIVPNQEIMQSEKQKLDAELEEEYGIGAKTYTGTIIETYDKYKNAILNAKDAVFKIEERNQQEY